jgi:hypothetical protein
MKFKIILSDVEIDIIIQALSEFENKWFSWFENDHDNNHVDCMAEDALELKQIQSIKKKLWKSRKVYRDES